MLNIGDKMIHQQEGACYVTKVVEKETGGVTKKYYVLQPLLDKKATIFISMDQPNSKRIRPVIAISDWLKTESEVDDITYEWITDSKKRFDRYTKVIRSFCFSDVLSVYKTLLIRTVDHQLNARDDQLLISAQKLICSELAMLHDRDYDTVVQNKLAQYLPEPLHS